MLSIQKAVEFRQMMKLDLEATRIHLHYPGNALRTDGPSAGMAMALAVLSAASGRPVRGNVAMTGEISLQGRILPIGGVKEKLLAAHRAGQNVILLPKANEKDLADLPAG